VIHSTILAYSIFGGRCYLSIQVASCQLIMFTQAWKQMRRSQRTEDKL